ncbi:MAG: type II toxin-antitoxin system Phd/YefM family antitoxin [Oscillospiraceae bacterium]|jgi:PHD/YefM family antitoxin component YafN of YafNO toxin-antitoxin module|nr:type II toxin-antitoxin system Phd/YefM family antitoxin [Oscillospiraceae bacterium]
MKPIIKPSSDLRKNYSQVAELCRTYKTPVFLTLNGEGDTVLMDLETYSRRENDLAVAERLFTAEKARAEGTCGLSIKEFENNMRKAIYEGVHVNV